MCVSSAVSQVRELHEFGCQPRMPPPKKKPGQRITSVSVLNGSLILCGRTEVEDADWRPYVEAEETKTPGLLLSAAGKNTEPYKYPPKAKLWQKLTVPVCFAHRDRNTSYFAAASAARKVLNEGGVVAGCSASMWCLNSKLSAWVVAPTCLP